MNRGSRGAHEVGSGSSEGSLQDPLGTTSWSRVQPTSDMDVGPREAAPLGSTGGQEHKWPPTHLMSQYLQVINQAYEWLICTILHPRRIHLSKDKFTWKAGFVYIEVLGPHWKWQHGEPCSGVDTPASVHKLCPQFPAPPKTATSWPPLGLRGTQANRHL